MPGSAAGGRLRDWMHCVDVVLLSPGVRSTDQAAKGGAPCPLLQSEGLQSASSESSCAELSLSASNFSFL